jgi:hypothetical protein
MSVIQWLFLYFCFTALTYAEPPKHMPPELYDAFTMNGRIPVIESYNDNTYQQFPLEKLQSSDVQTNTH